MVFVAMGNRSKQVTSLLLVTDMVYIEIYSFLQYVSIMKTKVLLPLACVTLDDLGDPLQALWFTCSQAFLNYLAFPPFDFK